MSTVYRPFGLQPNGLTTDKTRNMLLEQIFEATVQTSTSDYQVRIYKLSDNTLLYDSGKINLVTPLYASQELLVTIPITGALATERDLKWTLELWNGVDSAVSKETSFVNYELPTISLSVPATITEQSHQFIGLYSQNQGIGVSRFRFALYDSTQVLIEQTEWVYNSSLEKTFENFLDNADYYVECEVYDLNEQYATTDLVLFFVDYVAPSVSFVPTVINIANSATIQIKWIGAYILEGLSSGIISFISNFLYIGNNGLQINDGSYAYWEDVYIEEQFTASFIWQPNSDSFDGRFFGLNNVISGKYIEIGYSQTIGAFYKKNSDGSEYGNPLILDSSKAYILIIVGTTLTIKEYN